MTKTLPFYLILSLNLLFLSIIFCEQNINSFPKDSNTSFNLFTLKNRDKQIVLNFDANDITIQNSGFNPNLKTKIIVHGWTSGYYKTNLFNRLWMKDMKDYILGEMDCNVICVDWSKLAASLNYVEVLPNVPITGQMIAYFINRLIDVLKVSTNDIHCIGHSLGAHVCSFAAKSFPNNKLAQVTGLDPAWPGFDKHNPKTRLDPSDAQLVIVEHTSSGLVYSGDFNIDGFVGNPDSLGHYDFRINGGNVQPMCHEFKQTVDAIKDILELRLSKTQSDLESVGFCPHETAYIYPISKPTNGCKFIAYQCSNYEQFESGSCVQTAKPIPLSLDFYDNPNNNFNQTNPPNNLFIKTGDTYPYCLFHYQIVIKLEKLPTRDETIDVILNDTKRVDFSVKLLSVTNKKSYTYLYTNKNELAPSLKVTAVTISAEIGGISFNYLSDLNERKQKSFEINVIKKEKSSDQSGEPLLIHVLQHIL